jgi:S1-C subfamily serine protease
MLHAIARRFLAIFFVAFLVIACSSQPNYPPRPAAQELVSETAALTDDMGRIYCSGVWVSDDEVLTAAHCVIGMDDDGASGLTGTLKNSQTDHLRAFLITKFDPAHDYMLLQVPFHGYHGVATLAQAPAVPGDDLYIVGHPAGVGWSFVRGTVSALRPWMQVQAPIFGGFSGAGAFDSHGDLVGLCHQAHSKVPDLGKFSTLRDIRAFLGR